MGVDRLGLGDPGLLAQPGERVVLAEDGDHRAVFARLRHDGGRDAGDVPLDAEAFLFQHLQVFGNAAVFAVGKFGHVPDAGRTGRCSRPAWCRRSARICSLLRITLPPAAATGVACTKQAANGKRGRPLRTGPFLIVRGWLAVGMRQPSLVLLGEPVVSLLRVPAVDRLRLQYLHCTVHGATGAASWPSRPSRSGRSAAGRCCRRWRSGARCSARPL